MEGKRGSQLARMKAARLFNPLHVLSLGSPLTDADIRGLSIFRCAQHPKIEPKIEAMKGELPTYLRLVGEIKPRSARLDDKGKDTFDLLTSYVVAWERGQPPRLLVCAASHSY